MGDPMATPATKPPSSILNRLINLDTNLSLHIHTIFQPIPRSFLKALEISGDGRFWIPIPVALFLSPLSAKSPHLQSILIGLFVGFLLDLIHVGSLKYLVRRSRPLYNKGMYLTVAVDHYSFPSGHSSRVCFIATFLYLCSELLGEVVSRFDSFGVTEFLRNWRLVNSDGDIVGLVVLILFVWSGITSISRVLLGRHFVFDVIAGAALGVFQGFVVFYALKL